MKVIKKVLSILFVLIFACSVFACGGNGTTNNEQGNKPEEEPPAKTEFEFEYSQNAHNSYWHAYAQLLVPEDIARGTEVTVTIDIKTEKLKDEYTATSISTPIDYDEDNMYYVGLWEERHYYSKPVMSYDEIKDNEWQTITFDSVVINVPFLSFERTADFLDYSKYNIAYYVQQKNSVFLRIAHLPGKTSESCAMYKNVKITPKVA